MTTPSLPRPRQTTLAAGMIIVGSVFVVLTVWQTISGLTSIETREGIEKFLAEPPGKGMGLTVTSVTETLRVTAMVAAACATFCVVLGVYALQRNRQARVALSVIAVPLFLSGVVAGGFLSSLVAAACAMLWLSPSREWFRGEAAPPAAVRTAGATPRPAPVRPATAATAPPAAAPRHRPDALNAAVAITIIFSGLVLLMTVMGVAVMVASPDLVLEEMRRQNPELVDQGVTESLLRVTTFAMGGVCIVWAGTAIALAVLAMGGRRWAARGLLVSAVASAGLCAVAAVAALPAALPALAALATVACLRRPEVRQWFERGPVSP